MLDSSIPSTSSSTNSNSSPTMRLCYNGAANLLAATACPAAFVDLDSIREEATPRNFSRDDSVFFPSCSSSAVGSPLEDVAPLPSPFKFMDSLQRKRKSMFRRNQSSSSLLSNEKRRTCRRPSLPSIPPTIDEMSSSVGHARSRRPSLHNELWANEGGHRGNMAVLDNRIHHIDIEPQVNYFIAIFKDLDDRKEDYVEHIHFDYNQKLYEVLEPYLRARGLTINDVEIFVEKSSTPIPDVSAALYLAGQKIFVRGRGNMKVVRHTRAAHSMDESNDRATRKISAEAVSRKSSFVNSKFLNRGSRNHPTLNGSDDAECRSNDSSLSVRDGYQYDEPSCSEPADDGGTRRARSVTSSRISLFFGKEKNEMLQILNQRKKETDEYAAYKLEKDWREIVNNHQNLSDKSIKQQEAIWEIVTTEHRYIKLLRYLTELSMFLSELQSLGYMKDVDNRLVFHNFTQLHNVNYEFLWAPSIEPLLRHTRETGEPLDVNFLQSGFRDIESWSGCYTYFHLHHSEVLKHIQKKLKDSEQFRDFVSWAESQENLDRQKLIDTLSQPMQRLTRYVLLLKAVLKVTVDENDQEMLRTLVEFAEKATMQVNCELNNNDRRAKLGDIMRTIEGPEFVDLDEIERVLNIKVPFNLGDYMPLLHPLTPVNRTLFFRGDLRMQEGKKGSKIDVHCMLFTDMFLICRKVQGKKDRLKILKPPIHAGKIVFHYFPDQAGFHLLVMTDFNTPAALYSMYTANPDETYRWTDRLKQAIDEFKKIHSASWNRNPDGRRDSPLDEYNREFSFDGSQQNGFGSQKILPPGYQQNVIHRKASSMDSQAVAASYAHLNYMHRSSAASSAEQLDRHHNGMDNMKCTPPRHKLSVASCHANPLSSSKSSVDLYVSLGAENGDIERPRSRSNSSGPDIEGLKQRSRSSSPAQKDTGTPAEIDSPQMNTPCRDSPTLLITSEDCVEAPQSGRRFEKRYHTADGIDMLKPKGSMLSGNILKRFSWNVGSAVGSSRKRLESSRRISSTAAVTQGSMDSFSSSTSGISTASSNNNNDPTMEALATKLSHISTISINDTPPSIEPQATLSINLEAPPPVVPEKEEPQEPEKPQETIEVTVPPAPDMPPPSKTPSPNLPSQKAEKSNSKCQDFMKFILDNNLETSDV